MRYSLRTRVVSRLVVSSSVFSCLSSTHFLNDFDLGIFEQAEHISSENVPASAALKQLLLRNVPVIFSGPVSFKTKKGSGYHDTFPLSSPGFRSCKRILGLTVTVSP